MANPTISVIIPAFNAAKTIVSALDSVSSQGVPGLEIIVVDDGSTDETAEVVEKWRGECLCKVLRLRSNLGPAGARNAGIKEAKGEWIAFLDADDRWLKGKLTFQCGLMRGFPDAGLFCGRTTRLGDAATAVAGAGSGRIAGLEEFVISNPVATSTVLVRRDLLVEEGGFDGQFRGPEDYDLWMRFAVKNTIIVSDCVLAEYRATQGSLSMDDRAFLPQVLAVLDKGFGQSGALNSYASLRNAALSNQYWSASWMAFNRGSRAAAIRHLWTSFCYNCTSRKKLKRRWLSLLAGYMFGKAGE